MSKEEFRQRYVSRLVSRGGLTILEAEENFSAADDGRHWEEYAARDADPEGYADDEMSYWE